jgi:hypothetical protein
MNEKADWVGQELRENDAHDFADRLGRFREILDLFPLPEAEGDIGGHWETAIAFQEARFAYVNGLWLSTIFMSLVVIERHLAWSLPEAGSRRVTRLDAKSLIERARQVGILSDDMAKRIDTLREFRNQYVHPQESSRFYKRMFDLMDRAVAESANHGPDINMILHEEARAALVLLSSHFDAATRKRNPS